MYTIDSVFWLEKKDSRNWERLLGSDVTCPFDGSFSTLSSRTQMIQTDWSPVYGFLDAGLYRMGAKFFNGDQSLIQYAEFSIGAVGGVYGEGAEAVENLGFVVGGNVQVISRLGGNVIVNVKESRIAISEEMARKIMI